MSGVFNNSQVISLFFQTVLDYKIHLNSTERNLDEKWSEAICSLESNALLRGIIFNRSRLNRIHERYMIMRRKIEKDILNGTSNPDLEFLLRRIYTEVKEDRKSNPLKYKGIKPYNELPPSPKKGRTDDNDTDFILNGCSKEENDAEVLHQTKICLMSYDPELYDDFYKVVDRLLADGIIDQYLAYKAIEMANNQTHLDKMKKLPPMLLSFYIKNTSL